MANVTLPPEIWDHEVAAAPTAIDWLWQGFLAPGNLTLLTSQWKAGKTTLLSMLLSRRKEGGTLAGLQVRPGKTVVVAIPRPGRRGRPGRLRRLRPQGRPLPLLAPRARGRLEAGSLLRPLRGAEARARSPL
jgi:hypothetical protein